MESKKITNVGTFHIGGRLSQRWALDDTVYLIIQDDHVTYHVFIEGTDNRRELRVLEVRKEDGLISLRTEKGTFVLPLNPVKGLFANPLNVGEGAEGTFYPPLPNGRPVYGSLIGRLNRSVNIFMDSVKWAWS